MSTHRHPSVPDVLVELLGRAPLSRIDLLAGKHDDVACGFSANQLKQLTGLRDLLWGTKEMSGATIGDAEERYEKVRSLPLANSSSLTSLIIHLVNNAGEPPIAEFFTLQFPSLQILYVGNRIDFDIPQSFNEFMLAHTQLTTLLLPQFLMLLGPECLLRSCD